VFLDEPTSGVDPISRRQFWELIHEMVGDGMTVFVTTHYMDEAEYCNRLLLIDRGRIVAIGTPGDLKAHAMKGQLLLVEGSPLSTALDAVQHAPGIFDVAVFGNALHVVVRDAEQATSDIRAVLSGRHVDVGRIEPIAPSLEDVFVSLTASRDGARKEAS